MSNSFYEWTGRIFYVALGIVLLLGAIKLVDVVIDTEKRLVRDEEVIRAIIRYGMQPMSGYHVEPTEPDGKKY